MTTSVSKRKAPAKVKALRRVLGQTPVSVYPGHRRFGALAAGVS